MSSLGCSAIILFFLVICGGSLDLEGRYVLVSYASAAGKESFEIGRVELAMNETHVLETKDLLKAWAVVSDPDLAKFGHTWWMFFNSLQGSRTAIPAARNLDRDIGKD